MLQGVQWANMKSLKAKRASLQVFSAVLEKCSLISNTSIYYRNKHRIRHLGAVAFRNIGL